MCCILQKMNAPINPEAQEGFANDPLMCENDYIPPTFFAPKNSSAYNDVLDVREDSIKARKRVPL